MAKHGANNIRVAVETGVLLGDTSKKFAGMFDKVYGLELSEYYFNAAKKNCSELDNVEFRLGDSAVLLPELAETLKEPAMFYLDAHWFDREHVAGEAPFPLWDELACLGKRPYADLIIVDDAHTFGKPVGHVDEWSNVSMKTILQALGTDDVIASEILFDWGVVWRGGAEIAAAQS